MRCSLQCVDLSVDGILLISLGMPRDRADERQGDEHGDGVDDPQEDRRPGAAPLAPAQDGLEVVAVVAELAERPAVVLGAERVPARVAAGAALVALACV